MRVEDLEKKLGYGRACPGEGGREVLAGYTSDLLSDVIGNTPEDAVLITIQAHKNTVAVASLAGIAAIVLCNGRSAPQEMIDAAKDEEVAVYLTKDNQFTASWKVKELL